MLIAQVQDSIQRAPLTPVEINVQTVKLANQIFLEHQSMGEVVDILNAQLLVKNEQLLNTTEMFNSAQNSIEYQKILINSQKSLIDAQEEAFNAELKRMKRSRTNAWLITAGTIVSSAFIIYTISN